MNTLEAKFQIVTPMFLGGSDQIADGIRPGSIKGALRFWWRALNWARCLQERDGDEVQALRHLHAEEARLFGLAASEKGGKQMGGQGVFLLQVAEAKTSVVGQPFGPLNNGQTYLLGQGITKYFKDEKITRCVRNAIRERGTFTLKAIFRPGTRTEDKSQVRSAINALELLGALGSRARHGLGSIAGSTEMTRDEYVKAVQELLRPTLYASSEPPFTAFSGQSRVDISITGKDALSLLNNVGLEQQLYRSYGRNGLVNGTQAERNFTGDHDLIFDAINGTTPPQAPERVVFGLPHNYRFTSGSEATVNYVIREEDKPNKDKDARRSSPLLLHIHPVSKGGFVVVHTLMPAKFLPNVTNIQIVTWRDKKNRKDEYDTYAIQPSPHWQVLTDYLNRFIANGGEVIHGKQ